MIPCALIRSGRAHGNDPRRGAAKVLAVLLKHFSQIEDGRQSWRVAFPLAEMLLLLTCATIAACDDFDEIVAWGSHHLDFLRRFAPFHFGIPCAR
jgi:hypothetical protein